MDTYTCAADAAAAAKAQVAKLEKKKKKLAGGIYVYMSMCLN